MVETALRSDNSAGIWILDESPVFFERSLGVEYVVRFFYKASDLKRALALGKTGEEKLPTLLILNTNLGNLDMLDVIESRRDLPPPFLVVSTSNNLKTIESCFAAGAEDYLLKPLDETLFAIKVKRLMARKPTMPTPPGLWCDRFSQTVGTTKEDAQRFTVKEFQIFLILFEAFPNGANRTTLQNEIWKNVKVVPKALDVHIFKLRRKLEVLNFEIRFGVDGNYALTPME